MTSIMLPRLGFLALSEWECWRMQTKAQFDLCDVRWRELFLSVVPFCVSMFAVRVCVTGGNGE